MFVPEINAAISTGISLVFHGSTSLSGASWLNGIVLKFSRNASVSDELIVKCQTPVGI